MARPETPKLADSDAFSVSEFCTRHRISIQLFYKFRGDMPPTFRVGSRVLISREAAEAWRSVREKAATGHEGCLIPPPKR